MAGKTINARRFDKLNSARASLLDEGMISLDKGRIIKKEKIMKEKANEQKPKMPESGKKETKKTDDDYFEEQKSHHKDDKEGSLSEQEIKSSYILIGAIIVLILVGTGFFLIPKLFNKDPTNVIQGNYTYNKFKFEKRFGTWFTESQEGNNLFEVALVYGPKELANVTVEGSIYSFRQINEAYLTFDPTAKEFGDVTMANAEVSTKLAMHFGVKMIPACSKEAEVCKTAGAEIISCEANKTMGLGKGIIFLNQAPGPKVIIDGNCAIIQGEGADIIKAADRFMLGYYGIMK